MESLVGKLGHASRVVPPGKTSMMHMFELLGGTSPQPSAQTSCGGQLSWRHGMA